MATIQVCDLCNKKILNAPGMLGYKISKMGSIKMEICSECMNKFCEWAGLPIQDKMFYKPPKNGNAAQNN